MAIKKGGMIDNAFPAYRTKRFEWSAKQIDVMLKIIEKVKDIEDKDKRSFDSLALGDLALGADFDAQERKALDKLEHSIDELRQTFTGAHNANVADIPAAAVRNATIETLEKEYFDKEKYDDCIRICNGKIGEIDSMSPAYIADANVTAARDELTFLRDDAQLMKTVKTEMEKEKEHFKSNRFTDARNICHGLVTQLDAAIGTPATASRLRRLGPKRDEIGRRFADINMIIDSNTIRRAEENRLNNNPLTIAAAIFGRDADNVLQINEAVLQARIVVLNGHYQLCRNNCQDQLRNINNHAGNEQLEPLKTIKGNIAALKEEAEKRIAEGEFIFVASTDFMNAKTDFDNGFYTRCLIKFNNLMTRIGDKQGTEVNQIKNETNILKTRAEQQKTAISQKIHSTYQRVQQLRQEINEAANARTQALNVVNQANNALTQAQREEVGDNVERARNGYDDAQDKYNEAQDKYNNLNTEYNRLLDEVDANEVNYGHAISG